MEKLEFGTKSLKIHDQLISRSVNRRRIVVCPFQIFFTVGLFLTMKKFKKIPTVHGIALVVKK
jgi:hypothetical protein